MYPARHSVATRIVFAVEARPFRLPVAAGHQTHHSSCGKWLVFERDDGAYSLLDPFSDATAPVALLPSLSSVCVRHEPIVAVAERELLECRYSLTPRERDAEPQTAVSLLKLVVCSARLVAAVVGQGRHGKLALCRLGAPAWSLSGRDQWRRLKDMAFYRRKLYAVDQNEDLLADTVADDGSDDELPTISRLDRAIKGRPPPLSQFRRATLHYLVESGDGALLMVRREISRVRMQRAAPVTPEGAMDEDITVFRADFGRSRWKEERGALGGDQALFVGRWCSRAVRVPDERMKEWADRIFFLQDGTGEEWHVRRLRYSVSVYMVKGGNFSWSDLRGQREGGAAPAGDGVAERGLLDLWFGGNWLNASGAWPIILYRVSRDTIQVQIQL
ncbi:uncharacterized protein [Triticum aestivum]|uniref:uncharacterized protein n=1 Tax=Triticum aestivum TaxID=4565 RepID=UPI001D0027E5|nr:uncharacterized protein LOC123129519 [Triticum aestivum]